ncbi:MAG: ribosome biogenesis GTPase, partial [Planctomycetota bacterium]
MEDPLDPLDKAKIRKEALNRINRVVPLDEQKERKRRSQERRANAPRKRPRTRDWDVDDQEGQFDRLSCERHQAMRAPSHEVSDVTVSFGAGPEALIVSVQRGRVSVLLDDEQLNVELSSNLTRTQQSSVAVGDVVELEERGDSWRVIAVQARRSSLARPDPGKSGHERVIAANIDFAVVVLSVVSPPLHPGLIDRFLVALDYGGVTPILCVNKVDL